MSSIQERLDSRIKALDTKLADIDKVKPVDNSHQAKIDKAKYKLLVRREIAIADKKGLDNQLTTYANATHEQQRLSDEADKTHWEESREVARHEQLKKYYGQKYPGSYNPATNTIDTSKWSQADLQNYERSRKARNDAVLANRKKQQEAKDALAKRQEAAKKYAELKKKIEGHFIADNHLADPCVPCLSERQKKLDRIKEAFLGQQSFGNCGIQSSNQVVKLVTCKEADETELLKKSLRNGNASLVEKPPKTNKEKLAEALDPEAAKKARDTKIDAIQPVRKAGDPVIPGKIGENRGRNLDPEANTHNQTIIDIRKTGGTSPDNRQKIMDGEKVKSTTEEPTRDNIAKALKKNQVMIISVEAAKLSPAEDENGKPVETWIATEDRKGSDGTVVKKGESLGSGAHAITVADGKFDKDGKLTHVLVSDTGKGKMYYMKIEDFEKSLNRDKKMNVSKDPMKMSCP